jgi:hypothetical protein
MSRFIKSSGKQKKAKSRAHSSSCSLSPTENRRMSRSIKIMVINRKNFLKKLIDCRNQGTCPPDSLCQLIIAKIARCFGTKNLGGFTR